MFQPAASLTGSTANVQYRAGLAAIAAGQDRIDLGALTSVDSSALAALLGWQRAALKQGKSISFTNPPASLLSLAALYGVAGMLDLNGALPAERCDLPHH
jgi:phospholipid transport system transporter-binding protein